jgi:nucleotide-binding universal stress UspA family protein
MLADPNLLLCYDGSDQATEAIDFAAALFPHGTRATVLYAWEPTAVAVSVGMVPVAIPPDSDERNNAPRQAARRGRSPTGPLPRPRRREGRIEETTASAWRTIVDVADGEFDVIVMGTRGLSGVASLLLGQLLAPRRPARGLARCSSFPGASSARHGAGSRAPTGAPRPDSSCPAGGSTPGHNTATTGGTNGTLHQPQQWRE